jgi:hypothetical protein
MAAGCTLATHGFGLWLGGLFAATAAVVPVFRAIYAAGIWRNFRLGRQAS